LTPPAQPRPTLASLVSDVRTTIKLVARHTELRFVFYSMMALALFASTVYVVMTYAVQTLMGKGTAGVGYLGGLLGAGMIVGSLVVGTIGQRVSRAQIIVWCVGLTGVLMVVAGLLFSFVGFLPVAFLGGLVLAPITVSQDTMLHEHAPAGSRALVFSTKDLVLAASFAVSAFLVGGGVLVMDALGASQPYRVALFAVGGVIVLGAIATEVMVLRSSRGHVPIDQIGV
jgi:MFS family permease